MTNSKNEKTEIVYNSEVKELNRIRTEINQLEKGISQELDEVVVPSWLTELYAKVGFTNK